MNNPIFWFMLIWLLSIGISFWMSYYIVGNLIKEFADNGYLIDTNKLPDTGHGKIIICLLFIPIINIIFGFYLGIKYSQNSQTVGAASTIFADPMTEEQKEKYSKDPTVKTALLLMAENKNKEE